MSQQDSQSKEIKGHRYTVRMLDPLVANDLLIDIGEIIGPAIGAFVASEGKDHKTNADMIHEGIGGLFRRLSKEKMRETLDELAKVTDVRVKGDKEPTLDSIFTVHFRGRVGAMHEWFVFALGVQFADFFDSIQPAIDRVKELVSAAASTSPITSSGDGSSGESFEAA